MQDQVRIPLELELERIENNNIDRMDPSRKTTRRLHHHLAQNLRQHLHLHLRHKANPNLLLNPSHLQLRVAGKKREKKQSERKRSANAPRNLRRDERPRRRSGKRKRRPQRRPEKRQRRPKGKHGKREKRPRGNEKRLKRKPVRKKRRLTRRPKKRPNETQRHRRRRQSGSKLAHNKRHNEIAKLRKRS